MKVVDSTGRTKNSQSSSVLRETSGPTNLTMGAVADGELLARSGSTIDGIPVPSDMVLLETQVAAASAVIDFLLTGSKAGYAEYIFKFSNVAPATDDAGFWMRTSTNGGSSYDAGANDYGWSRTRSVAAGAFTDGDDTDSKIELTNTATAGLGNAANEDASGSVQILSPSATKYCRANWQFCYARPDGLISGVIGYGARLTAADVDAIRFMMSTGNIASGTFRLYGLRASSQVVNTTNATAATQSEMEAASSQAVFASPGVVQYHPGVAKAWLYVTLSGGTPTVAGSHNVSSLTDNGVGDFTVNFTTAFSSANYSSVFTASNSDNTATNNRIAVQNQATAKSATVTRVRIGNSADTVVDGHWNGAFFGDQ